ncbi:hypothetical protein Sfulv_05210 [Streptomyces fulvorobeus]|uniref:Uncharacterized protein n=1 Tax=Streptomyces fulvorobeus TaxID=284028 RepID=A0A7J0BZL9_9ACTN|nr:hypothetical protein Sfulv_05210 [Streptomyces fulvorobeus]
MTPRLRATVSGRVQTDPYPTQRRFGKVFVMTDVLLTVGTRKGLFTGRRRDGAWEFGGPHFNAQAIYSIAIDTRRETPGCSSAATARTGAPPSSTPTISGRPGSSRSGRR